MQAPGPAQLELIRRYARTLRHLQSEARRAGGPRSFAREPLLREQAARFTRLDQHQRDAEAASGPPAPA